jgi:hypothetical protein
MDFFARLLGNFAKHQRAFSKLVIHLVAVYCHALQNGALYPEAKVNFFFLNFKKPNTFSGKVQKFLN